MRYVFIAAACLVLGLLVGGATGWYKVQQAPWPGHPIVKDYDPSKKTATIVRPENKPERRPNSPEGGPLPDVEVPEPEFDFGKIESEKHGQHEFVIKNVGDADLVLTRGETTCRCTVMNFDQITVPPGGITKVLIDWNAEKFAGPITQRATIYTNDPDEPEITLTVKGRVMQSIRTVPKEIVFSRVRAGQPATAVVKVLGYRDHPIHVTSVDLMDKQLADSFLVTFEPIPEAALSKEDPDATNGYYVRVQLKPGLPLGTFAQKLIIHTDQEDLDTFDVGITGRIESDVEISGPAWVSNQGYLFLDAVNAKEGKESRLMIRLQGFPADQLKIEVEDRNPPLLEVEVEEPKSIGGGLSTLVPVTIRVPPNSGPANFMSTDPNKMGSITLKTNNPGAPRIKIGVRFAIVD